MRLSKVLGVRKLTMKTTVVTMGLVISAFLSLAVGIFTFYGQNSGNFVMSIDPASYTRGIILCDDTEFLAPTPRLLANPVSDVKDITYSWLKLEEAKATDGDFIDQDYKYVAYTFYLKNIGSETLDINYSVNITDIYLEVDKAIRVLIIEDDTIEKMYQKADAVEYEYPEDMPPGIAFVSEDVICNTKVANLRPNTYRKFSVLIWLEGEDPDCVDAILGGMIKLQMRFVIAGAEEK